MRFLPALFLAVTTGFLPAIASAHTLLMSPVPRTDDDGLKVGPCGGVEPTGIVTEAAPGDTITVSWLETIDHNGYYRIAFAPDGQAEYDDNVLADNIPDIVCASPPCNYSAQVTLPTVACDGCSLQIIQYMGNAPPYSPYFSCADLRLVAAETEPPGDSEIPRDPGPDEEPADDADGEPEQPTDDLEPEPSPMVVGGCATGARAPSHPIGAALWIGLGWIAVRRSHRRR